MHAIYRRCRQALVWLGMDDSHTEEAFECARFIHKNGFDRETPLESLALFRSPAVCFANLKNYLRLLANLTYRPWFERAWTFQEVILSSTVLLVCGKSAMALECLEASWEPAFCQTGAPFNGPARTIFATRKIEDTFLEDGGRLPAYDLERLLTFRREAKMSDPRDYIFSLLGLFSPSVSLLLSPSYSTSVKVLFTVVAKQIIRASRKLRILCTVESPKHIDGEAFPSWVSDWRASSESIENVLHDRDRRSSPYRATRASVLDYDPCSKGNGLHLYGILIGSVDQAGRCNDFHSISDFDLGGRYDHTNQQITTALRQTQTLDFGAVYGRIGLKHPDRRSLENFFDIQRKSSIRRRKCKQCPIVHTMPILPMEKAKQNPNPNLAHLVWNCRENMRSRAFFTTDSRYFGFGPNCTAAGDQIFLLIGSDIPFILRPAGKEFELVGACYVHGVMYGEGLCQNSYINKQFYPGSVPSGTWDFSSEKVPTAEWRTIEEKGDNSHIGGSVCRRLARTTWDTTSEELKDRETRRYLLSEDGRSPVLINTKRVIIK